jgi:peptide/nickel transport system permease protein
MSKFLAQKIAQYALVIFITVTINFFLPRLMPGNPLVYLAGEDVAFLTAEEKASLLSDYGLDKPLGQQYGIYLKNITTGNFGYSYQKKKPIADIIRDRLPWTLLLTGSALILSSLLGVVFGAAAAWRRGTKTDAALLIQFMFFNSMPSFWVGMILVAIFGATLRWFPIYGAQRAWMPLSGWAYYKDILRHLVLPLTTLVLISIPSTFMIMRYSMLNVLGEDYVLMAKAKGLRENTIKYRYAVRNALLPMVTIFMLQLGYMFSGATVIETVFAYPGLGRLMFEAVTGRDYPVLQASFLIITVAVVLGNLLADLLYPLVDPKVRR